MSPALQAKLLRVLQEREFERVGDSHTDQDRRARDRGDAFRSREDGGGRDVPRGSLLSPERHPGAAAAAPRAARRHSAARAAFPAEAVRRRAGAAPSTMSQEALRRLMAYHWPGNVRQLENVVERALAFSQGRSQIDVQDLAPEIQNAAGAGDVERVWFPDDGIDFERYIAGDRAVADQAVARAHAGQQAAGGEAAEPEAHDAHRETEAPRAATRHCQSCHNRRTVQCLPDTPTGRSSSKASRPRFARRRRKSCCRRSSSCRRASRRGDDVVRARAAVDVGQKSEARRDDRQSGARQGRARERRGPDWRPGGEHKDPRERFEIPRDEKRAALPRRLYRDRRTEAPRRAPPPRATGRRPERPRSAERDEPSRPARPRATEGDAPATLATGLATEPAAWRARSPSRTAARCDHAEPGDGIAIADWKPSRPPRRADGDRPRRKPDGGSNPPAAVRDDRDRKATATPAAPPGAGRRDRPDWKPSRPGTARGGGDRERPAGRPTRPPASAVGATDHGLEARSTAVRRSVGDRGRKPAGRPASGDPGRPAWRRGAACRRPAVRRQPDGARSDRSRRGGGPAAAGGPRRRRTGAVAAEAAAEDRRDDRPRRPVQAARRRSLQTPSGRRCSTASRRRARTIPVDPASCASASACKHGLPGYEQAMREDFEYAADRGVRRRRRTEGYLAHPLHEAIGRTSRSRRVRRWRTTTMVEQRVDVRARAIGEPAVVRPFRSRRTAR